MFSSVMLSQIIRFYGHAMQGMMGTYLEKNIQAFIDIQQKLTDQSKGLYDGNALNPEVWSQFMNMQAPMMQGMMTSYIEQSKNMFVQMQEQMQTQAKSMFNTFPFPPPTPPRFRKRSNRFSADLSRCNAAPVTARARFLANRADALTLRINARMTDYLFRNRARLIRVLWRSGTATNRSQRFFLVSTVVS